VIKVLLPKWNEEEGLVFIDFVNTVVTEFNS